MRNKQAERMENAMTMIRRWMNRFAEILSIGSMGVLVCLVTWQVITRFVLNNPSTYTEQLARYTFVWVVLINAAYVFGKREHMNISYLVGKMPASAGLICNVITELCTLAFMLLVMVAGGIAAVNIGMSQMDAALPARMGVFYLAMPLCGVMTAVYSVLNLHDMVRNYRKEAAK